MRLDSLHLKNFRQYSDTRIEFRPGLTAIVGANGAGKTTLLEAIAWALYGSPAIRGNNESLKRAGAPARSPVETTLEFSLGSHRYRIFRRPDRAEMYVDGGPSPVHAGLQPVAEAVRKLLGMDYRAFFTSYFTGQKELAFLAGMGKQERAAFVGRMLGYDRLSRAREKSNQERLALDKEIEGLQRGMADPSEIAVARKNAESTLAEAQKLAGTSQKRMEKTRKTLESLRPKFELSDERRLRYEDLQSQIKLAVQARDHTQNEIRYFKDELAKLDALERELREIQPEVDLYQKAEAEFDAMRPLIAHERERRTLIGKHSHLKEKIESLRQQSEGLEAARFLRQTVQARREQAENSLARAQEDLARLQEEWNVRKADFLAEQKSLQAKVRSIMERRTRVESLGEHGECPVCSRPLEDELHSVLSHFSREIEETNRSLQQTQMQLQALGHEPAGSASLKAAIVQHTKEIKELKDREAKAGHRVYEIELADGSLREHLKELAEVENKLASLPDGYDQERYDELAEIAKRLKPVNKRGVEVRSALERRPELTTGLQEAEKRWVEQAESMDDLEKRVRSTKFEPEAHRTLKSEFDAAAADERSAEREASEARTELARAEEAVRNARAREEEYERKADALRERQKRRLYLRTLTEALESLRQELNARARPELEEAAGRFLEALTDGRYSMLELTESYEPFILDDNERKPVISGGEEDVTHLCLRLAISQMIADRSGQPLSLLVLDEIFGSLDAVRRENVVALLQNLKSSFEQIILITHVESVNDIVDQCLWVRYDAEKRASRIAEEKGEVGDLEGPADPLALSPWDAEDGVFDREADGPETHDGIPEAA